MRGTAYLKSIALTIALAAAIVAPRAEAAPDAAALGPEAGLAQPSGGFIGKLALEPPHGPVGTNVTARAEGLPPNQDIDLVWRTMKGAWKAANGEYTGREYKPVAYRIAGLHSDAAGRATASFAAPEDFGFAHDVVLQQGNRLLTQSAFSIDMQVTLSPASGPIGTPIAVEIHGIGWRGLESSWLLRYDNNFTGWVSSITRGGVAKFTIPATGAPGTHVLELMHGEFTFPYLNPQQNPVPDRPRFAMSFHVTPGGAVLPPPPQDQVQRAVRDLPQQGALVATPRFAQVGDAMEVRGTGFTPNKTYPLNWTTLTGNRVASTAAGFEESSRAIAEARADASGNLAFRFAVPDDLGGGHTLWVQEGNAKKTGALWITPKALPLDVARGPAGTDFTIHLKGVGWTETANIYTLVYDGSYIGYACGFNSQGDVTIHLKASGEPGWHFIDLYPAIYKGKETRPDNFRIPQLTYAADHPGEDLPAFHFAFEVTPGQERASAP
jgi:hypothetical protein